MHRLKRRRYRLPLPDQSGILYAHVTEITHLQSEGNYTTVHLFNGERRMVCRSIGDLECCLSGRGFLRVHQSYLVNLRYVTEYLREGGGKILLAGGGHAYLARSRKREFFAAMQDRSV
ncbi:LytR/AlgR family response regulator transcription factor [Neolewinella litorea]|uniref:LytR/AlgR family response regulator transcription factor n=1 Tax=Neolewinella litorea TaxID=2562452 RepID=UPI001455FD6E|nr:LytTR family DNA-binding domain-containing protein [Neolewinella litorea]